MDRRQALKTLSAPGMPLEMGNTEVYGKTRRIYKNAPKSLRELFSQTLSNETFLVFEEERYSFNETWALASAIGSGLVKDYGIEKGDRVAICMRNFPEWIIAFQAITSVGAIAVALNSLCQTEELIYGVTNCGCKLLIADQERSNLVADVSLSCHILLVRGDAKSPHSGWAELVERHRDAEMPAVTIESLDDVLILYTSGSTGRPKGVVSSNLAVISALLSWEMSLQIWMMLIDEPLKPPAQQPAGLAAVPLFHTTGCHAVFLSAFRSQTKLVLIRKWDPVAAARLIEKEQISSFIAPSTMTGDLVFYAKQNGYDLSSLRSVGGGGAARAPEQVKSIDNAFSNAIPNTGWGMTETNAIGTAIAGELYLDKPSSSGFPAAVLDIRIADKDGCSLQSGERGEVQIQGTSMFRGYWNNQTATDESHTSDWFKTGDIGYLDNEGYLFIVDRIKDMVIRGGENIGCGEVEAALLEHPSVREACVFAVPDERLGEEVGATICCISPISEDELRSFLKGHLSAFKIPRYLDFTGTLLPRTGSGKIFKLEIRKTAIERFIGIHK
tara:strand:- start:205 stop:1872 length:1668 start_codon:yes stop_codon:yes gene_type:complete